MIMGTCNKLPEYAKEFKKVLEYTGESRDEEFKVRYQELAGQILERDILQVVDSRNDTNFLRKERAYIILNWLMQQGNKKQKRYARGALQAAMHNVNEKLHVHKALEEGEEKLNIPAPRRKA